ncbi:cytochrome C oxidase subunit IV family protein [Colwellia psychrerythraea]|uniref:cytochrome C oxidase subunit IV family protein n=1 Tax=Colwellia psychrerythraea TaxID=28229 RepID=UPI000A9BF9D8|nr:cytochrome C oxidase subunit IV family protein [Colwellia psychrerythraea]
MQNNKAINMTAATKGWFLLITLSIIAVYLPEFVDSRSVTIMGALVIVALKGQQIVDIFMELNNAPKLWRTLFLSYIVLVPLIITVIYLA